MKRVQLGTKTKVSEVIDLDYETNLINRDYQTHLSKKWQLIYNMRVLEEVCATNFEALEDYKIAKTAELAAMTL